MSQKVQNSVKKFRNCTEEFGNRVIKVSGFIFVRVLK